jgi:predicted SprT family Zn-dependent metalloprotease
MTPHELERRLLLEIVSEWELCNAVLFKRSLRPPQFRLIESETTLGRFSAGTRVIELARNLVLKKPWTETIEVLKHEMAHQYVYEVLQVRDETAHGPQFRAVCEARGIDARAHGPAREEAGERSPRHTVLEKIAKLLALAESDNRNEAEAAMMRAERLLAEYNISQADLIKTYGYRHLGEVRGRVFEPDRVLASILSGFFFVQAIWVSSYRPGDGVRGSVLEICGSDDNLDFAEYVYGFLKHTSERLWLEHAKTLQVTPITSLATRSGRATRTRTSFLAGVMNGFLEKLAQSKQARTEAGIVLTKDHQLQGYFGKRHPRVRHVSYQVTRDSNAYRKGKDVGGAIVLSKPLRGHAGSAGPKLLPGKRS